MERPPHAGLRHLALNARDLAAMKQFYVDVLGFAVEWEPDADNVYLSSGIDNLALHRSAKASRSNDGASRSNDGASRSKGSQAADDEWSARLQPSESPLDHLGLIVRTADDVDRWAAFLESRGIPLDAQPKTHRDGARSCYFSDPDGNKVQIIHHPPISERV
jgi:catechol 2,3-dioxygenase-like lactoylglutathione lyase family enzyme